MNFVAGELLDVDSLECGSLLSLISGELAPRPCLGMGRHRCFSGLALLVGDCGGLCRKQACFTKA